MASDDRSCLGPCPSLSSVSGQNGIDSLEAARLRNLPSRQDVGGVDGDPDEPTEKTAEGDPTGKVPVGYKVDTPNRAKRTQPPRPGAGLRKSHVRIFPSSRRQCRGDARDRLG
jgi:hypothetical protein